MKKKGQAMVEFVIALLAIVLVVAFIADFIIIASRRSEIFTSLRGEAGSDAMSASGADNAGALRATAGQTLVAPAEASLVSGFTEAEKKEEFILPDDAFRNWVLSGARDFVTIGDHVWMPPLQVSGVGAQ